MVVCWWYDYCGDEYDGDVDDDDGMMDDYVSDEKTNYYYCPVEKVGNGMTGPICPRFYFWKLSHDCQWWASSWTRPQK